MQTFLLFAAVLLGGSEPPPFCNDLAACTRECDAGNALSCVNAAAFAAQSKDSKPAEIAALFRKGYEAQISRGCTGYALFMLGSGKVVPRDVPGALKLAVWACDAGDLVGCEMAARLLLEGEEGIPADPARALSIHEAACEKGWARSCGIAGELLMFKREIPRDRERATKRYQQGCDAGDMKSCTGLASLLFDESADRKQNAAAFAIYEKACKGGEGEACFELGHYLVYPRVGDPKDKKKALDYHRQGCDLGSGRACYSAWDDGKGEFSLLERACELGNRCDTLGEQFLSRNPPDRLKAAKAYERGCTLPWELGQRDSCYELARVLKDAKESRKRETHSLLASACQAEDPNAQACRALAKALVDGSFAVKDERWAFRIIKGTCESGADKKACTDLAFFYVNGTGVAADPSEGKRLLREQCNAERHSYACGALGAFLVLDSEFENAARVLTLACEDHERGACGLLGVLRSEGKGLKWDPVKAAEEFEDACGRLMSGPSSCANLGEVYELGYVRPRDLKKALQLFETACSRGSGFGCVKLGIFLRDGIEVKADKKRAEAVFRTACEVESGEGCYELAALLRAEKRGDATELAKLERTAFEQATRVAMFGSGQTLLGTLTLAGAGTPKDPAKALEYFASGCENNDLPGCMKAGAILKKCTAAEAARAASYFDKVCSVSHKPACEQAAAARERSSSAP